MKNNIISSVLLGIVYRVNYLSSSGQRWEGMVNLREIFPFAYMPAGRTFWVAWWIIYVAIWVWLLWTRTKTWNEHKVNQKIIPWFWVSCMLNIIWILSTAYELYSLSVGIIILLMVTLWKILDLTQRDSTYFIRIPFGLYAWWVTMATTVIGIWQLFYTLGSPLPTTTVWMIGSLLLGICVAWWLFYRYRNLAQLTITIVALIGIGLSIFG